MLYEHNYKLRTDSGFKNKIKVIGVGGGGGNAVRYMEKVGIHDVDFIICNTDSQALDLASDNIKKLQLGKEATQGLGAGMDVAMGRLAAEESEEAIRAMLQPPTVMTFITAGMGGGTGTGAAPVIAKIAKEMGLLVVAVVTDPFKFEGKDKIPAAQAGIKQLKECCDTVLVIKNDRLSQMHGNMPISKAYSKADDVLANAVKSIAELITRPGIINLDFADVKKVLTEAGVAMIGSAEADGADRAAKAIKAAVQSPLLESNDIKGAQRVLVSVSYSDESPEYEIQMDDQTTITDFVESQIQLEARLFKYGFAIDKTLGSKVRVTVIAAKFDEIEEKKKEEINDPSEEAKRIADLIDMFTREGFNHTELRTPAYLRSTIKLHDLDSILKSKYEAIALDDFYGMLEEKKMV
jgi:cell division protein FtsZ